MRESKLYLVKGSEDGNLGIYSNLKKAYETSLFYFNDNERDQEILIDFEPTSYELFREKMIKKCHCEIGIIGGSSVNIELFYLNNERE